MARKKQSELRPLEPQTNDLNDEQKGALFGQGIEKLVTQIRRRDEATSAVNLQRKQMKSEGFSREEVDYALWLRKQEGEEPKERVELQIRVAAWMKRPLGLQGDLFASAAQ